MKSRFSTGCIARPSRVIFGLLLLVTCTAARAQKLPALQKNGLAAPAGVKIDGRIREWGDTLQAFNTHTDFYYSLANDRETLYLVIRADDQGVIRRIMNGGLTLSVRRADAADRKDGAGVTFPVFEKNNRFRPYFTAAGQRAVSLSGMGGARPAGSPAKAAQLDSLMELNNKSFQAKARSIATFGMKDVDSSCQFITTMA